MERVCCVLVERIQSELYTVTRVSPARTALTLCLPWRQEHKRALSRGALARLSAEEIRRTRLQDLCRLFEGFDAERAKEHALQPAPTNCEETSTPVTLSTPATAIPPHLDAAELEEARREVAPLLVD